MILNADILKYLDQSILCWLATSSSENFPNVSPKEIFAPYDKEYVIIANIASPNSIKNIQSNPNVCLSFVDVLVQKGYQLKGHASIITQNDESYSELSILIDTMTQGKYPYSSIIKIHIQSAKQILAPSYILFPETTEAQQIENAKKAYNLDS